MVELGIVLLVAAVAVENRVNETNSVAENSEKASTENSIGDCSNEKVEHVNDLDHVVC